MNMIKICTCTACGIVGTAITTIFGGFTEDMITLVVVMAVDFIMGLIIALILKKSPKTESGAASSKNCFMGLCKKCVMLLFVLVAHRLDVTLHINYIKTATVIGFIVNELMSIIENAGLMGIPLPDVLKKGIDLLKGEVGKDE